MSDAFSRCHPAVNFCFFAAVIGCSMFLMHPVFLAASFCCAAVYSVYLNRSRAVRFGVCGLLPMALLVAVINPLFSHQGVTILTYLRDNPITLESILYGTAMGVMFGAVILWFSCYNVIMTSDKFLYLFGRVIPALSLIFSMVLRFVPKFKAQLSRISEGQMCIGRDLKSGNVLQRARHGLRILSILVTWALENAVETADSMRSRGYGLKGRTSFSNFRLDTRDKVLLGIMGGLAVLFLAGAALGETRMRYFPSVAMKAPGFFSIMIYSAYTAFLLLPVGLDLWEDLQWQRIRSKI